MINHLLGMPAQSSYLSYSFCNPLRLLFPASSKSKQSTGDNLKPDDKFSEPLFATDHTFCNSVDFSRPSSPFDATTESTWGRLNNSLTQLFERATSQEILIYWDAIRKNADTHYTQNLDLTHPLLSPLLPRKLQWNKMLDLLITYEEVLHAESLNHLSLDEIKLFLVEYANTRFELVPPRPTRLINPFNSQVIGNSNDTFGDGNCLPRSMALALYHSPQGKEWAESFVGTLNVEIPLTDPSRRAVIIEAISKYFREQAANNFDRMEDAINRFLPDITRCLQMPIQCEPIVLQSYLQTAFPDSLCPPILTELLKLKGDNVTEDMVLNCLMSFRDARQSVLNQSGTFMQPDDFTNTIVSVMGRIESKTLSGDPITLFVMKVAGIQFSVAKCYRYEHYEWVN